MFQGWYLGLLGWEPKDRFVWSHVRADGEGTQVRCMCWRSAINNYPLYFAGSASGLPTRANPDDPGDQYTFCFGGEEETFQWCNLSKWTSVKLHPSSLLWYLNIQDNPSLTVISYFILGPISVYYVTWLHISISLYWCQFTDCLAPSLIDYMEWKYVIWGYQTD